MKRTQISPVRLPLNPSLDVRRGREINHWHGRDKSIKNMVAAGRKSPLCIGTKERGRACCLAGNAVNGETEMGFASKWEKGL